MIDHHVPIDNITILTSYEPKHASIAWLHSIDVFIDWPDISCSLNEMPVFHFPTGEFFKIRRRDTPV
jgi:hypothetical protein